MTPILPVSPGERAQCILRPETEQAARLALATFGFVLLRGVLDVALIDGLADEFTARYGRFDGAAMHLLAERPPPNPVLQVGDARFEITLALTGPFGDPHLFANQLLRSVLAGQLGDGMKLSGVTAVVSYGGSAQQHVHRDHAYLFSDHDPALNLPPHAINCSVPLIDVDEATGPTAIWPGSHKWTATRAATADGAFIVPFTRGDAILMDYRTMHTGLPNRGTRPRPILYMVYARPWFFDDVNHLGRTPLDMPLEDFARLPDDVKPLLSRAYTQAVRARWHQIGGTLAPGEL